MRKIATLFTVLMLSGVLAFSQGRSVSGTVKEATTGSPVSNATVKIQPAVNYANIDNSNALQIPIFCVFDIKLHHNQKDRLQTDLYFKRVADGFNSQFKAIQAGLVSPWGRENYGTVSMFVFSIFLFTEKFWMAVLALTPAKGFSKINNKLIGKLSGLQRFKSWKRFNENLKD